MPPRQRSCRADEGRATSSFDRALERRSFAVVNRGDRARVDGDASMLRHALLATLLACGSGAPHAHGPAPAPTRAVPSPVFHAPPAPAPALVVVTPSPAPVPELPPREGAPPRLGPERPYPEGAIGPDPGPPGACDLELRTGAVPQPDGTYELIARGKSWSASPLRVTVPNVCPGAAPAFSGLPRGYDYYGTCNQGACFAPASGRRVIEIPPGGWVDIATTRIDPRGDGCNRPLPPGDYHVRYTLDVQGATVCPAPMNTVHVAGAPPPAPPRPAAAPNACPPSPTCGLGGCPYGYAVDPNGCSLCACADPPGGHPILVQ